MFFFYFYVFLFLFWVFSLLFLFFFRYLEVWWAWFWLGKIKKKSINFQYGLLAWANRAVFDIHTHIWTYIIELDYLVLMLDKVWVNCVQFPHLCMCDKVNFSPLPFVKGLLLSTAYLYIPSGRIYTYICVMVVHTYIYMLCVCISLCSFLLVVCVIVLFLSFIWNEVACAAPKTVIHFMSKVAILFA